MNAPSKPKAEGAQPVDEPEGIGALAEQMRAHGVHQVRYYVAGRFSVELLDGRKGVGRGVMAAIRNAKAEVPNKAAA